MLLACSNRLNVTVCQLYIIIDPFQATVFLNHDRLSKREMALMMECIHRVKRKSSACAGLITATNTVRPCTAIHNEAVVLGTWSDRDACRCPLCLLHMRGLGVGGVAASLKTAARKEPGLD